MTTSNGNIFRITGHLCGEFTGRRWIPHTKPVARSSVFFDLRLNKRLSKQSWGWWFETLSRPLWRHRNVVRNTVPVELDMSVIPQVLDCEVLLAMCHVLSFQNHYRRKWRPTKRHCAARVGKIQFTRYRLIVFVEITEDLIQLICRGRAMGRSLLIQNLTKVLL